MKEFEGLKVPDEDALDCNDVNCDADFGCTECIFDRKNSIKLAKYIATHKTPLTELYVPFGMLSEEKQRALRGSELTDFRWSNIEFYSESLGKFVRRARGSFWGKTVIYRLDPDWSPENPKEARKRELIAELEALGAVENGKIIK